MSQPRVRLYSAVLAILWLSTNAAYSYGQAVEGGYIPWRSADSDGKNCLYLQLRICGYTKSFEHWRSEAGARNLHTMADLQRCALDLGYSLEVRRLAFDDLTSVRVPITVYLEEGGINSGIFVVLCNIDQGVVWFWDGRTLEFKGMPIENFRRAWTGHALIFEKGSNIFLIGRVSALMVCLIMLALAVNKRRQKT
jgi:ABC-type bacteriocin/lantibiotic exporter with double-glycine peptidase domain